MPLAIASSGRDRPGVGAVERRGAVFVGSGSTSVHGWDSHTTSNGEFSGVTLVKERFSPSNDQLAVTVSVLSVTSIRSRNTV